MEASPQYVAAKVLEEKKLKEAATVPENGDILIHWVPSPHFHEKRTLEANKFVSIRRPTNTLCGFIVFICSTTDPVQDNLIARCKHVCRKSLRRLRDGLYIDLEHMKTAELMISEHLEERLEEVARILRGGEHHDPALAQDPKDTEWTSDMAIALQQLLATVAKDEKEFKWQEEEDTISASKPPIVKATPRNGGETKEWWTWEEFEKWKEDEDATNKGKGYKIAYFKVPIVRATPRNGGDPKSFYTIREFEKWKEENRNEGNKGKGHKIEYFKTLDAEKVRKLLQALIVFLDRTSGAAKIQHPALSQFLRTIFASLSLGPKFHKKKPKPSKNDVGDL